MTSRAFVATGIAAALLLTGCGGDDATVATATATSTATAATVTAATVTAAADPATKAVVTATADGDVKAVTKLLDQGADVNALDEYGLNLLDAAAINGDPKLIRLLLSRGAKLTADEAVAASTVRLIITEGDDDPELVRALDKAGLDPDLTEAGTPGHSALMIAAEVGHVKIGEALLDAGADIDKLDTFGDPAVNVAAFQGHLGFVKMLVARDAALDFIGRLDRGAAAHARSSGYPKIADYLVSVGAPE